LHFKSSSKNKLFGQFSPANRSRIGVQGVWMQVAPNECFPMIKKQEVSIKKGRSKHAKNYLNEENMKLVGLLWSNTWHCRNNSQTANANAIMNDWIERLDSILQLKLQGFTNPRR